jgi:hypothetical protein
VEEEEEEETRNVYKLLLEYLKGKDQLDNAGIDERMILKLILEIVQEGVNLIHLVQDRKNWWAF